MNRVIMIIGGVIDLKKIMSHIIGAIVIGVGCYLVIANVLQFFYLRQYENFDFSSPQMNRVRTNYQLLEKNIVAIDALDTSVFTEEDLIKVQENMKENLEAIKKNQLLAYQGTKKIYLKDLLDYDLKNSTGMLTILQTLQILEKYDSSLSHVTNLFKDEYVSNAYLNEFSVQNAFNGYQYHTGSLFQQNILEPANYKILSKIYNLNLCISKLNYLATIVLEVGEAHV